MSKINLENSNEINSELNGKGLLFSKESKGEEVKAFGLSFAEEAVDHSNGADMKEMGRTLRATMTGGFDADSVED